MGPWTLKMVKNNRAWILWDLKFPIDKQLLANKPDIVVVDKEQTISAMEQLEQMQKVKSKMVLVLIGALGIVTPKIGE